MGRRVLRVNKPGLRVDIQVERMVKRVLRILIHLDTPFPNLFSVATCHMKTRPYLGDLYLMKENEEKH